MTKQRRLLCNPSHIANLTIYKTNHTGFYTNYRSYFLGEKLTAKETETSYIDLTTQSTSTKKLSNTQGMLAAAKKLQQFTYKTSLFYYRKLKFTGKGYKIKKSKLKKSFKLYFGRSHTQYLFSGGLRFKKLSKYRLFLLSNNKKRLNRIMTLTLKTRPLNRYTKRGLRCTRQFVLKRPGKKSTY